MPDGLYMSFNQEFSGNNEYPSTLICPSVSYSFWSDTPDISFQVGQSLLWNDVLTAQIKGNYDTSTIPAIDDKNITLSLLKFTSAMKLLESATVILSGNG